MVYGAVVDQKVKDATLVDRVVVDEKMKDATVVDRVVVDEAVDNEVVDVMPE